MVRSIQYCAYILALVRALALEGRREALHVVEQLAARALARVLPAPRHAPGVQARGVRVRHLLSMQGQQYFLTLFDRQLVALAKAPLVKSSRRPLSVEAAGSPCLGWFLTVFGVLKRMPERFR